MDAFVKQVTNDGEYQEQLEKVNLLIKEDSSNNSKKDLTLKLLKCLNDVVTLEDYEPKAKYYAILMAKDFFLKKYSVFISCLASSALLQSMTKMGKTIDPKKEVDEKGLTLFPDRTLGNKLMTLILECIVKWSEKHPTVSEKSSQPTKFKAAHNELVNEGVLLPRKFTYFPNTNMSGSESRPVQNTSANQQRYKKPRQESEKRSESDHRFDNKNINRNLRLSMNKIDGFLSFLRDCDQPDEAEREINKYHRLFQQQSNRYNSVTNQVLDQGLLDDYWTSVLFLMSEFYSKENELHQTYLIKDTDIKSYIVQVTAASEMLKAKVAGSDYASVQDSKQEKSQWKRVNSITEQVRHSGFAPKAQKSKRDQIKPKIYDSYMPEEFSGVSDILAIKVKSPPPEKSQPPNRTAIQVKTYVDAQLSDQAEKGAMIIKQIFKEEYHPRTSFIQLRKDLQKQRTFKSKNSTIKNRSIRKTRAKGNQLEEKKYGGFQEMFIPIEQTNISKMSVFQMHPRVENDQYPGRVLNNELNYQYQLEEINANQSLRRFKICAFKERYLLFENEVFQIGFHSKPVFRNHKKYPSVLNITVFIGNKTDTDAEEVVISFEGDKTNAIYACPLNIPKLIDVGMQIKQNLVVVPLKFPFNLLNFKLKYNHKGKLYRVNVFLPYMINKFAVFQDADKGQLIQQMYQDQSNILRSRVFNLSRKIPPSLLLKYFPKSVQLTSYKQFVSQKSYCEYKIGLKALLLNKYKCCFVITIRPDMTTVIQMAYRQASHSNQSEQGTLVAGILLSTLQFILNNNQGSSAD